MQRWCLERIVHVSKISDLRVPGVGFVSRFSGCAAADAGLVWYLNVLLFDEHEMIHCRSPRIQPSTRTSASYLLLALDWALVGLCMGLGSHMRTSDS